METAGVGYLSFYLFFIYLFINYFITSVSKNLRRLLQMNGFYRGHRRLLNKEKYLERDAKAEDSSYYMEGDL